MNLDKQMGRLVEQGTKEGTSMAGYGFVVPDDVWAELVKLSQAAALTPIKEFAPIMWKREPDAPGWWYRARYKQDTEVGGVWMLVECMVSGRTGEEPTESLVVYDALTEEHVPVGRFVKPLARWCGPVEIPEQP